MTYDLALYPASGPGLGHLMRCYALAEAAVEMGAKVIVLLDDENLLAWPCPVAIARGAHIELKAGTVITDGISGWVEAGWAIIDSLATAPSDCQGYIYPHFGATPIPGYPTFYGPQWMPLRKTFRQPNTGKLDPLWTLVYKAPPVETEFASKWEPLGEVITAENFDGCREAVVPPSTIAYEALSRNLDLYLHDGVEGTSHIAQAMYGACVALPLSERQAPKEHMKERFIKGLIDGRGAIRLLEALL